MTPGYNDNPHGNTSGLAWYGIYYIYSWAWNTLLVQPQVDILIENCDRFVFAYLALSENEG